MRTRRRTYTTATPASLSLEALTAKPIVQSGNRRGSKKTKKCNRTWDLNLPTELLQEILSRLGLKANIQASAVCKTWCEYAVSVRKWQPRPWIFYPGSKFGTFILFDRLRSHQTYKKIYPELKDFMFCYSRDGWLLVNTYSPSVLLLLLNPFTSECIYLPKGSGYCSAFSAAPTSSSCLVISIAGQRNSCLMVKTWRPGSTVWTTHCFDNQLQCHKCVFSNGMFYCLSGDGCLGVFDPSLTTWNVLPVKPCPDFRLPNFTTPVVLIEHEGDIFVMYKLDNTSLFKLNLQRMVWEAKRELSGLTIFASYTTSLARVFLSAEERNRIYPWHDIKFKSKGMSHFLGDEKISHPLLWPNWSHHIAWVDPPHNNFNL